MWSRPFLGTDIYHIVHWFFIYSILGWIVESIYMSICNKKLTNRGFIFGPICPIYGVGALTVFFLLRGYADNFFKLYIMGAFLATSLEYVTARIMIRIFGSVWWDYSEKPYNYKGILCLESTIAWGFYTLFLFVFLQENVQRIVGLYPFRIGKWIGAGLIVYYLVDFTISMYRAKRERIPDYMEDIKESVRHLLYR